MRLFALALPFLASLSIWIVCLIEILKGNALETFQLGNVITSKTALGYTYLDVLVTDTLVFLAILFFGFFEFRRYLEERSLLKKYGGDKSLAKIVNLDSNSTRSSSTYDSYDPD